MNRVNFNLNTGIYIGIDAHTQEHTAVALNRFEEEKDKIRFDNSLTGIGSFMKWMKKQDPSFQKTLIGIEGAGNAGQLLTSTIVSKVENVYEVNPLYTKQRREFNTKADKSDSLDARLIAGVIIRKFKQLPKITTETVSPTFLSLKKIVWFYEDLSIQKARIKNHLHVLNRDWILSQNDEQNQMLEFIINSKKQGLKKILKLQKDLKEKLLSLLPPQGKQVMRLKGISIVLAAKLVAHTKRVERFANINKFIQYAGIAPVERSSGKSHTHRQSSKGNRLLNATLYLIAINQLRWNEKARAYFDKKVKEGKTKKHALRCLMKRVACIVYGVMKNPRGE